MHIDLEAELSAPVGVVFGVMANPDRYADAVPDIVRVETLSQVRSGLGTRFRETRRQGKREASATMEITECVEDEQLVFRSEMAGTTWETTYSLGTEPGSGGTRVRMKMVATPRKFVARLLLPLIKKKIGAALANDLEAVDRFCRRLVTKDGEAYGTGAEREGLPPCCR